MRPRKGLEQRLGLKPQARQAKPAKAGWLTAGFSPQGSAGQRLRLKPQARQAKPAEAGRLTAGFSPQGRPRAGGGYAAA